MLTVEGHIDVIEQACSFQIITLRLIECWHFADDGSCFVDSITPGPSIHRVVLSEIIGLLVLVLISLKVRSRATDGSLVRFVKGLVRLLVVKFVVCTFNGPLGLFNREIFLNLEANLKILNELGCNIIHIDKQSQSSAASDSTTFGGEAGQVNFIAVHLKCLFAFRIMNTIHCH